MFKKNMYHILNLNFDYCWFHGSSFKGFSIVFPVFWLAKSNHLKSRIERVFFGHFSRHICSAVTETIRVTNYATSFGAKKYSDNQVWSCWEDSWSVEPTISTYLWCQILQFCTISNNCKFYLIPYWTTLVNWKQSYSSFSEELDFPHSKIL